MKRVQSWGERFAAAPKMLCEVLKTALKTFKTIE
jgi:hypothetical protein